MQTKLTPYVVSTERVAIDNGCMYFIDFGNLANFNSIDFTKTVSSVNNHHIRSVISSIREEDWSGIKNCTLEDVKNVLKNGWNKVREKFKTATESYEYLESVQEYIKRIRLWTEEGEEIDVDKWRLGREDCFLAHQRKKVPVQRMVNLNIPYQYACRITVDEIFQYGIECLAFVDALETSGYRVRVNFYGIGTDVYQNGDHFGAFMIGKDYNEAVNLNAFHFLCLPAFFRGFIFLAMDSYENRTLGHYGYPDQNNRYLQKLMKAKPEMSYFEKALFCPSISTRDSIKHLKEFLRKAKLGEIDTEEVK